VPFKRGVRIVGLNSDGSFSGFRKSHYSEKEWLFPNNVLAEMASKSSCINQLTGIERYLNV